MPDIVGIIISTSWRTQRVILNQWGIGSKWWDIRSRRWSQPEAGIPLISESSVESLWLCSSKKYVGSFLGSCRNSKVYTHYKSTILGNQPMCFFRETSHDHPAWFRFFTPRWWANLRHPRPHGWWFRWSPSIHCLGTRHGPSWNYHALIWIIWSYGICMDIKRILVK